MILKPDKGERGKEVFLIQDFDQLVEKVKNSHYSTLLLQTYCSYPNEAGILFYRYPNQKQGVISSVTTKEFWCFERRWAVKLGRIASQKYACKTQA